MSETVPKKRLLSTSSPEGLSVASRITSTRIANLLIREGPQPIRRITSQLAVEVVGFDLLSLSKQRRLIMAAMEQVDPENNVVFEKIGWGQWAVRRVDSDYIYTEGNSEAKFSLDEEAKKLSVQELRNQTGVKLGWTKKQPQSGVLSSMSPPKLKHPVIPADASKLRRESISANKHNLHNIKVPMETSTTTSNAIESDSEDDFALSDEMDDVDDEEDDSDESDDGAGDSALFKFDDDSLPNQSIDKFKRQLKSPPPIKFANRVPLKVSPPPGTGPTIMNGQRRRSSTSTTNSVSKSYSYSQRHQIFNRSRLNSLENLDNYILSSAKGSGASLASPPPPGVTSAVIAAAANGQPTNNNYSQSQQYSPAGPHGNSLSSSPWNPGYYIHNSSGSPDSIAATMSGGRRKSSFNESHIRSTLSSSLPKVQVEMKNGTYEDSTHSRSTNSVYKHSPPMSKVQLKGEQPLSDTDEEDWATIGAESLRSGIARRNRAAEEAEANNRNNNNSSSNNIEERNAAYALVDLMSV
ncbi:hypothetical protein CAAN1_23S02212 [[Candida] anglica]|uniref:Uncharacterized protein n=1 Tax=[Candida] anglica TaxID=148631 RepID=A0ABP0EBF2_9ASCO